MAGFVYRFGIRDTSETKVEISALGAFVSWAVNRLRQGMNCQLLILPFFFLQKTKKNQKKPKKKRREVMVRNVVRHFQCHCCNQLLL